MPTRKTGPQPLEFTAADPLLASFAPVVARDTRTLILGSLPGVASLAASQYYGHPRNAFWRLVGDSIGVDLVGLDYETRLSVLLEHRIGLWDVIANARRIGSLDSAIREHSQNDLVTLIDTLPDLTTVAFNGGTAAKIGMKALGERALRYRTLLLPSSSPAHASLSYAQKLEIWRRLAASNAAPG
ncbi:DNA-deoxyinosine glycosylase [Herbaspirillum sp. SJZ099]|uniref:DNA-deoxyinosine glycosylase n=1 Tax=Herbaspirillum sp. SJZ099 TaxID=2572916 RepID=UPI0011AA97A1|nr:DNA-deoxyinosine glycosylase [Herbaspirillum sp. SJZ099]TWC64541.1 G/U mismatch-specific uracil-DNA glycosylase [Herbaspirillum sp. SJZ099]